MPSVAILLALLVPPTATASRALALVSAIAATARPAAADRCLAAAAQPARTRSLRHAPQDTHTLRLRAAATKQSRTVLQTICLL